MEPMIAAGAADQEVRIPANGYALQGSLSIPPQALGIVLFAHGSGSSRHSARNRFVASVLQRSRIATLLFDLLTRSEEALDANTGHLRFDIGLLAERLAQATHWWRQQPQAAQLPLGYFGASTGGAAALVAAAEPNNAVAAVVSRGGRPDLALKALPRVTAPTLLIVGGHDEAVIRMNQAAYAELRCTKELQLVPGATHLFEEPGALEAVAELAAAWFGTHLSRRT